MYFTETQEPLSKPQHPMYVTTSNSYGALQLTVEMTPNSFHGRSQKFSEVHNIVEVRNLYICMR